MLQSSYLPDDSDKWDTSWARNFLKISEDQLSKLESIPEWLPNANLAKGATNTQEISADELQKEPLLPSAALPENLNKDNPVEKRDICSKGKKLLKKIARMDSDFDISVSYSQPEMGSYKSTPIFPRPLEKLGDHILSHKYLKGSTPIMNKPEKEVLFPSPTEVPKESEPMEETSARLELSGKEKSKPADEEESAIKNSMDTSEVGSKEVSASIENPSDKPEVESNEEISNSKICTAASVVEDSFRCESIPVNPSDKAEVESNEEISNSKIFTTASVVEDSFKCESIPRNPSNKAEGESNEEISNSKICTAASVVEDSFRCESIPCGQPVNVAVDPSPSPVESSVDVANKEGGGLEKRDAATALRSPNKDNSLHSSPHGSGSSGTKRKRKSKGDTPKHSRDAKRPRNLNIHFTSDQVKNMLKILRPSHS